MLVAAQLMTAELRGGGSESALFGLVGDAMSTACETLPQVGVDKVLMDFSNPAGGVSIDEASTLLSEHGVAVQPLDGQPGGRIVADGGAGDTTPVVDGGVVARAGGAPSDLSLPTSFRGSLWFTLACTPDEPQAASRRWTCPRSRGGGWLGLVATGVNVLLMPAAIVGLLAGISGVRRAGDDLDAAALRLGVALLTSVLLALGALMSGSGVLAATGVATVAMFTLAWRRCEQLRIQMPEALHRRRRLP